MVELFEPAGAGEVAKPSVSATRCGVEGAPVIVIDNFARAPESLVDIAETLTFADHGEYYPGPRAHAPKSYFAGVADIVAPIARSAFGGKTSVRLIRALYSIATRPPSALSLAQRVPHIDSIDRNSIAVVHYLCGPNHGGTAFYRHRSTGFEMIDAPRHAQFLGALKADFEKLGAPPPSYIDGDTAIFERIHRVDPKFNRAVIYPGNLLHCAELSNDTPLSASLRSGRLTIAIFLQVD